MSLLVSRDSTEYISLNADDGQIYTVAYRNQKTTKLKNENNKPKTETRGIPKQKHTNAKENQTRNTKLNQEKTKLNNKTRKQN